ncbi:hypothetical protein AHOG_01470 [Actinoalloteichus hoggarensis]|uniref:Uncharacterized protein n=1 Tax=Actinoalloteichus hoggarensis TaxID=1470176 RepID=A0A221VWN2_9PSEU|nr:hypothetical protein AHOG_01470 [Actinoalloteichus hoggarensis]
MTEPVYAPAQFAPSSRQGPGRKERASTADATLNDTGPSRKPGRAWSLLEPPKGIEPLTYALRVPQSPVQSGTGSFTRRSEPFRNLR